MTENKIDRGNLRRQAQRVESYKSLISRQRSTLKNTPLRRLNSVEEPLKGDTVQCHTKEPEQDEQNIKNNNISSPGSSTPSSSSDSSLDFRLNLCSSLKAIQNMPYQSEREVSSVMTRSATRKYASVGAIHNRVDVEKELKITKHWPCHVSYPLPSLGEDLIQLRDVVTRSFSEVLTFCKTAMELDNGESQSISEGNTYWASHEGTESFMDLSPYLTQESDNGNDENHITFHLNEDYIAHPFVNILALSEEDQEGTLVIHEEDDEYETITLHSGETYLVDNKFFSKSNDSGCSINDAQTFSPGTFPDDPMIAIYNDHTYAAKPNENFVSRDVEVHSKPLFQKKEGNEFNLENSLNNLLLNTAILKCLICNETPQEIMSQLDMAQSYLYSSNGFV